MYRFFLNEQLSQFIREESIEKNQDKVIKNYLKELMPYVKKTRTSMDFMKTKYVSKKNKKLINKYVIQLEKIQEAFVINEENDSDSRKYRKPLWHVTGHWCHYKSGKTVFIQGYWKGVERDNKDVVIAPVEISLDNWINISNESAK